MNKTFLYLFCIALFSSGNANAQLVIDLSGPKNITESIGNDLDPILVIKNLLPGQINDYSYKINLEEGTIPPFEVGKFMSTACPEDNGNSAYRDARKKILGATNESDLPNLIKDLQQEIDKLDEKYADCKKEGKSLIAKTILSSSLGFPLQINQIIKITVKRFYKNGDKQDSITWTKTFKTPEKTPWKIMYGFTFVPNFLSKVDNYYAKATDATNQSYTITKFNKNSKGSWENISPTIMFQWTPSSVKKDGGKSIQFGLTGGLSLNFSKETGIANVLFGPSIVIAQNVSISTGLVFTQKNVLKGKYAEGDVISENLDFDQLHDKKFMIENFISIAFRFDKNPFNSKDDTAGK